MISLIWVMNITCGINKEEKLYVRIDSQKTLEVLAIFV